jgi:hypothetical protein
MRLTCIATILFGAALAGPLGAQCLITDFEPFNAPFANGTILFRQPSFSGSTAGFLNTLDGPNSSQVVEGEQNHTSGGSKSIKVQWRFLSDLAAPWLRLTTFNMLRIPNPEISFTHKLRVWIYVPSGTPDFYLTLAVRETNISAGCAGNAGTLNGIEWIGATNATGPPQGKLVDQKDQWVEVVFDPQSDPIRAFAGITANGVLDGDNGSLEHLAFTPTSPGNIGPYVVYIDDVESFADVRMPGDVNGDGCVDDSDLLAVLFAFGNTGEDLDEDLTGDGVVDDSDLLEVLFNFGNGCG